MREIGLIFQAAIDKWGIESQETMAIEEMAELIKVICKLHRKQNGSNLTQLSEEIADVRLMLDQLAWAYCQEGRCRQFREEKLTRLERIIWPE